MACMAKSKRYSVQLLEQNFGIALSLAKVYRMTDKLDDKKQNKALDKSTYQALGEGASSVAELNA